MAQSDPLHQTTREGMPADEAVAYLNYEYAGADALTVRAVSSVTAEINRLRAALREVEELAADTPDEAAMEGALDAIRSCCEGALANG